MSVQRIPVWARGNVVVAWALVDDADVELVSRVRWNLDQDGYACGSPRRGVKYRMHRLVLGLERGDPREADHLNGDRLDNRRSNLRAATRQENGQNMVGRVGAASRFRCVYFQPDRYRRKPWRARPVLEGKAHHLGYFASEEEASAVVEAWRAEHMPFSTPERSARA